MYRRVDWRLDGGDSDNSSEVNYGKGRNKVRLECIGLSDTSRFPEILSAL